MRARRSLPVATDEERTMLAEIGARHQLWSQVAEPSIQARGDENTTFFIEGYVIRRSEDSESVDREVELLTKLAAATTVPTPIPLAYESDLGVFVYRALPGTSLLLRRQRSPSNIEGALVEVLAALRRVGPESRLPVDDYTNESWHRDAAGHFDEIRAHLDVDRAEVVSDFLAAPPPPARADLVPQHNDLGAEHILVDDQGNVTGIIDWTDAAWADPARDAGLIYRDLGSGPAFRVSQTLNGPLTDDDVSRIQFHARCKWIEDVRFGLEAPLLRALYLSNASLVFDRTFTAPA